MTIATYDPGDIVTITFTIRDSNSALFDPATVKFHYTNPAGTLETKGYGTDSVVTKTGTGVYQLVIYVPYAAASCGTWHYDGQALDGSANSLLVESSGFFVRDLVD